jgi:exopolyphosphatase/guanosine-5'-triphosphate,3'-diphosphate pyrophosphatase
VSLPVGVVTLAERHGGMTVTAELFEKMVQEVTGYLAEFAVANGGDLEGVHLDLPRYDRKRIDGCWLTDGEISGVVERLVGMDYDARVASPCIGAERADLVLAGCAILEAIRRAFPCPRLRVADRGLREGMLVELMRADGAWGGA